MSGVKAKLKVVLQADETIVAESDDAALWQRILLAINGGAGRSDPLAGAPGAEAGDSDAAKVHKADENFGGESQELQRFAKWLGIAPSILQGACAPAKVSPYLTLDMHCWNAMKEQTPSRGIGSMSPMAIAGTLMALWMQSAKLGNATQAEGQKILATIGTRDSNPVRSIQSSDWLQGRAGGVIVINPARSKRAVAIARAFCSQDWRSDLAWKGIAPNE
jgi:hypothetical protein